jgi:hypothetical protein
MEDAEIAFRQRLLEIITDNLKRKVDQLTLRLTKSV